MPSYGSQAGTEQSLLGGGLVNGHFGNGKLRFSECCIEA